jgi:pimeloyl-ACP methyl ester carboxylesterase
MEKLFEVMGPPPREERRVDLDVRVIGEERGAGYVRRKITFQSEPGDRCSAWLTIPLACLDAGERRPAMVCLHQTTSIGKDEPMGLGGLPNLHYARELAERGYVTIAPDYPNFGEYRCDPYALGYASATMKGTWNHRRAVDVLAAMPGVDAARIGCIGHSLGGHNTLFLAAFEPRIKAAVSSCGFTMFKWNRNDGQGEPGDVSDWSHKGYMPRIAERYGCRAERMPFEWSDVLGEVAPRAVFINAPERDAFDVRGVRECVEIIRPRYEHAGSADDLQVRHPDCEHDFPPAVREEAYRFLGRVLRQADGQRSPTTRNSP